MTGDGEQKAAIISEATRLFSRFGLEKTTMEDIAKAARKGK
ncbi:MAG: TetR family transcriptional regulator, partial [Deltaproteobacteria bacterium]|nr:TetR family transcriptional regulator [Deltaproteobacteria bacterium]